MGIILKIIENPPNYHMYYYKVHPQERNFSKFPSLYKIKHIQSFTLKEYPTSHKKKEKKRKEYPTLYTVCYHVNPRCAHTTRPHLDFEHKTKTKVNHLLVTKTTSSLSLFILYKPTCPASQAHSLKTQEKVITYKESCSLRD